MKEIALILVLMDKAVRQHSLYGSAHPQTMRALSEWESKLREFFGPGASLSLQVERNTFKAGTEVVFVLDKRENNYVQEMYIDGIRQLEFLPTITLQELRDLCAVLARDVQSYDVREDDTVTLLWKKGFQNLRYQTVDIYAGDLLASLQHSLRDSEFDEMGQTEKRYLDAFIESLVSPGNTAPLRPIAESPYTPDFLRDLDTPVPLSRFQRNPDDVTALAEEVARASTRDTLPEIGLVLTEVLEAQTEPERLPPLLDAYLSMVDRLLRGGDLRTATEWLKRFRAAQVFLARGLPETHLAGEEAMDRFAESGIFQALAERAAKGIQATPEDWTQLFTYLGRYTARATCEILARIDQETLHNAFSTFLITHAADQTDVFAQFMKRPEWAVVRSMVRVLGALLKNPNQVQIFQHVAIHPHPEVRLEVVRTMENFRNPLADGMLKRGLTDTSAEVREAALRMIGKRKDSAFAKALAEIVTKESFLERDEREKRRVMVTFARCGQTSALDLLAQIVEQAGSSEFEVELRVAALYGLAEIDDPRAVSLLTAQTKGLFGHRAVRETATQLLQKRAKGRKESDHA